MPRLSLHPPRAHDDRPEPLGLAGAPEPQGELVLRGLGEERGRAGAEDRLRELEDVARGGGAGLEEVERERRVERRRGRREERVERRPARAVVARRREGRERGARVAGAAGRVPDVGVAVARDADDAGPPAPARTRARARRRS